MNDEVLLRAAELLQEPPTPDLLARLAKLDRESPVQLDDIETRLRAVEIAVMRHSAILKEAQ